MGYDAGIERPILCVIRLLKKPENCRSHYIEHIIWKIVRHLSKMITVSISIPRANRILCCGEGGAQAQGRCPRRDGE